MARLYFLSNVDSTLTAPGDFSKRLLPNRSGSMTSVSTTIAGNTTETAYGYTSPVDPGVAGTSVGTYTFSVNCTTSASNMTLAFAAARVNSSGVQQSISATSSSVDLTTTGVKTTTLSSVDLGTFSSTDQLRVSYIFTNGGSGNRSPDIGVNDPDTYVLTPFTVKHFGIS